jgi:oligosaccharyltransferase complex subunit alpha (ribophorin I)
LELKPRYPILGGWNYSFVIGYDVPLSDMLKTDGGRKVLSIPFLTGYKDLAAEEVELKIVLPEGARYVSSRTSYISPIFSFLDVSFSEPVEAGRLCESG